MEAPGRPQARCRLAASQHGGTKRHAADGGAGGGAAAMLAVHRTRCHAFTQEGCPAVASACTASIAVHSHLAPTHQQPAAEEHCHAPAVLQELSHTAAWVQARPRPLVPASGAWQCPAQQQVQQVAVSFGQHDSGVVQCSVTAAMARDSSGGTRIDGTQGSTRVWHVQAWPPLALGVGAEQPLPGCIPGTCVAEGVLCKGSGAVLAGPVMAAIGIAKQEPLDPLGQAGPF